MAAGSTRSLRKLPRPPDSGSELQQPSHDRRGRVQSLVRDAQKLVERDPGARAWQVDRPHVMQRNAGEELVRAQRRPFELSLRDLRHVSHSVNVDHFDPVVKRPKLRRRSAKPITIAREQKSISMATRAETTYAEYRRQKASASGGYGFRLPLW
jgi:hypothetical protein